MDKKRRVSEDVHYEGRDKAYMDIDRIINEGLSGGSVHGRGGDVNIEQARELHEEEPPYEAE
ncbi:hypothetical protein LIS77_06240 [Cytobacillus firmus]|uniref:Uncharacterized protein n=1 Tax=Cytobacillus firmus TaxID=1399 RepID=A0AA46PSP6_CYTFI|nr:hypothetical protein [Cytobacillus firmus]MBG9443182.1 hypothetical protein [Cytobacillus firmus]MBG9547862.1 hypothetical protein [Cytobacillus firmus]MBG9589722.1 hypothetical protein [Cytobacillus firmus]MBG9601169.1 hypothetical protein [Cytobacillus firmus]MBG9656157.1 hypothetical protein [Cytobacillus firmus]